MNEKIQQLENTYKAALNIRAAWEPDWKQITDYLIPGRGIYNLYKSPQKRQLISTKVINPAGREALDTLTSGFHGGLTSPDRPWFDLSFTDHRLNSHRQLVLWLEECRNILLKGFSDSNFYPTAHTFYTECAGFGTASMYLGEDTDNEAPFRFELLTVGEYVLIYNTRRRLRQFFRSMFKTYKNIYDEWGDKASDEVKSNVKNNPLEYRVVHHAVIDEPFRDKPFTSYYWEEGSENFLQTQGFYEFPFLACAWDIIGSDDYGVGLGIKALPDLKRLQEMEKAFLRVVHTEADPPVNAPAFMKGKVKTLPGGVNYYTNNKDVITPVTTVRHNIEALAMAIERVEGKIDKTFFSDLFLTASRDPNASPLKATEVSAKREERLLRIGPNIERFLTDFIGPLIERSFNIAARKELLPPLPPELIELVANSGGYNVGFISPLAQAQKAIAAQPITNFFQFAAGATQYNPEVLDRIDFDAAIDEYHDIAGAPKKILRSLEDANKIRKQRREAQAKAQAKAEQMATRGAELDQGQVEANIAKTYSDAGVNLTDTLGNTQL